MKVWAIFSIANEYYQPENNLEKLFLNKPSFQELFDWWEGYVDEENHYDKRDRIKAMLEGEDVRFTKMGGHYRIEEVDVQVN